MKRIQRVKPLSQISSKPMGIFVFRVTHSFSFMDTLLKRLNPTFFNIKDDAILFFLHQKVEIPIVHHYQRHLFHENYANFYALFSNVFKKHIATHLFSEKIYQNSLNLKTLVTNKTNIKPLFFSYLSSLEIATREELFQDKSKHSYLNFPTKKIQKIQNFFQSKKLSSSVEIHKGVELFQDKQHSSIYSHNETLKEKNQQLNFVNIQSQTSTLFSKENSSNIFNLLEENAHAYLAKSVTNKHQSKALISMPSNVELNSKDSKRIAFSTLQRRLTLNQLATQLFHSKHNAVHNRIISSERNYTNNTENSDDENVEIIYKKETLKQVQSTSNKISNDSAVQNKTHALSSLSIVNDIASTKNIETIKKHMEKKIIQKMNSNVMENIEAKWSREITRRGEDYAR